MPILSSSNLGGYRAASHPTPATSQLRSSLRCPSTEGRQEEEGSTRWRANEGDGRGLGRNDHAYSPFSGSWTVNDCSLIQSWANERLRTMVPP